MSTRIMIANRGEIAVRIARSLIESSYIPVGVYTKEDENALHRRYLVEDREVSSYLDIKDLVDAALEMGAEAIHPGYGFLSENSEFAREVARRGLIFIGPTPSIIDLAGDKIALKILAEKIEVPVLPWCEVRGPEDIYEFARTHGYPVIIKAVGGGGGRGCRVVWSSSEIEKATEAARKEAEAAFRDPRLYVEPYLEHAKHIEVQVLGDGDNVVHLYERECSVQRRFQKIVEEAPSPSITHWEREKLLEYAVTLAKQLRYKSAGTIEFLFDNKRREFYLMEVNARLQVEHPITEMITRVDIVKKQVEIALYSVLDLKQNNVEVHGHSIEVRVYAENPLTGEPSPGVVMRYREPSGPGIRVDSGIAENSKVSAKYDPLVAKVIAWGPTRIVSISRLKMALEDYTIEGVATNIPLLKYVISSEEFASGTYTTEFFKEKENYFKELIKEALELQSATLIALLELGDKSVKELYEKKIGIRGVISTEHIKRLKRSAWYYYTQLKYSLPTRIRKQRKPPVKHK